MLNLVDITAMICLSLSGSCLLWFAKDGVSEAERKALDNDLIRFSIAFSVVLIPFLFHAGSHIIYSQLSLKAKATKGDEIGAIRKALTGLAAADGEVLQSFLTNLSEWDYFFTLQCSSVIYFEYFGKQSLRPGYTTLFLEDDEKIRRINSGVKNAGSQGNAFKASKQEDTDLSKAKFGDPAPAIEEPKKMHYESSEVTCVPSSFSNGADELPQEFHPTPRLQVTTPRTPREGPATPR